MPWTGDKAKQYEKGHESKILGQIRCRVGAPKVIFLKLASDHGVLIQFVIWSLF